MIEAEDRPEEAPNEGAEVPSADVAIIGMAGRFPGARNIDEFWRNLCDGVESIRRMSEEELLAAGVSRSDLADPDYVRACPVLDDVDKFDAGFFGFSPRDASVMDPAHRFFLEVVYEALEHAGCSGLPDEGPVGVFAGSGAAYYYMDHLRSDPALMRSMGEFLVRHTGNDMNFLATRASYELDLRGPSIAVQTACSSALVSVHLAAQSLLRDECRVALAGGSTILLPPVAGYHYKEGEILSPDGHCRPFDHKSAGTVFGSGTGVVVLKRLDDALDDGDTIHAVVKGSAVNNDGAMKVGYLAPGVEGQVGVIRDALKAAGLGARDISFVEAHGTGTSVGDPIELTALQQAFDDSTEDRRFCAVGSVKSNIGHLGEAAAAASLIKAILALKHRKLPPTLGFEKPNPQFDLENSAFFVNDTLAELQPRGDAPLRCGITALGAGGTNCHVILEAPPAPLEGEGARSHQLIQVSARSPASLDALCDRLAEAFESDSPPDLADAAYTLAVGRRGHPHRRVLVAFSHAEAAQLLRERPRKRVVSQAHDGVAPALVFMFPGGGAQYAGMGRDLYEREEVYREAVDECLALINPVLGRDLAELMFAAPDDVEAATRTLERPTLTLPSLFATSYALGRLFMSWGLEPSAVVGHSMGEYVAACLAGVFSLQDALELVMLRGRLFEATEEGGMVSVALGEEQARELMPDSLCIAAVNAPELCVASGPAAAIAEFEETLRKRDVDFTHVHIDVAAHSSMLDPILEEFRAACRKIDLSAPEIPFPSNLTGTWITDEQATDPEYWVQQLRNTVRFADCVQTLQTRGECVVVELGPGRTLSTLARAQHDPVRLSINSMRHPQEAADDLEYALLTLGRLWLAGVDVDAHALYDGQLRNRIPLPLYPFDHQRYWVEPKGTADRGALEGELVKREDQNQWFYGMSWAQRPLAAGVPEGGTHTWLVFEDAWGLAKKLRARLGPGAQMIGVLPGDELERLSDHQWQLDPTSFTQFRELLENLARDQQLPQHVVYMWGMTPARRAGAALRSLLPSKRSGWSGDDRTIALNFHGVVNIGRAIGELEEPAQLSVITNDSAQLLRERIDPFKALSLGPVGVIPREFPLVRTRCIDVSPEGALLGLNDTAVEQLARELRAPSDDRVVALRSGMRWVRRVDPIALAEAPERREWVREGGTYLITGGLGGIGLSVARSMARTRGVKLALLGRHGLPAESEWDAILERPGGDPRRAEQVRAVRALQEAGATVSVVAADVTDRDSLRAGLERVRGTLGPLTGVVHAAGRMDDAPMQHKTTEAMNRVLAAKVAGTQLLDELIHEDLEYFVLFSSIASFVGLPGQVDYTAANAFEDAFARERSQRAAGRTLVVNWSAWRDVGMAAEALHASERPLSGEPCDHPALDVGSRDGESRIFGTEFSIDGHWLLSEHRIKGSDSLIPGTGFLELIRAAFCEDRSEAAVELSGVTFVAPFQVKPGKTRRLTIELTPAGDEMSKVVLHSGSKEHPHVVGAVRAYPDAAPPKVDLDAVAARCDVREERTKDRFLDQSFVDFGPRWACIDVTRYGHGEALSELSIDERFVSDLEHYEFHPAVMDMATGGCQALIPDFDRGGEFFVPLSYETVRIFGPTPRRCFSHVRYLPQAAQGLAGFDVTLCDGAGNVVAEIQRFMMKRVDPASVGAGFVDSHEEPAGNAQLAAVLREAIRPDEGIEVLDRILAQPDVVQVVASSVDPVLWTRQLDAEATRGEGDGMDALVFERPAGAGDFVQPEGETEVALATIWSELLGIKEVGATDDFFELGGDSLVAVRLMRRIKKNYGLDFGIARLFEAPHIRALSALIDGQAAPTVATAAQGPDLPSTVERIASIRDWGRRPVWEKREAEAGGNGKTPCWLVFMDEAGVGDALVKRLRDSKQTVSLVRTGDTFSRRPGGEYVVAPERGRAGFDQLLQALREADAFPTHIVHLWLVTATERFRPGSSFFHQNLQDGFYSLLYLAQALGGESSRPDVHVLGVTSGAQAVGADEHVEHPEKATLLGPLMSMPREIERLTSSYVDVRLSAGTVEALAAAIQREARLAAPGEFSALRGKERLVRRFEPLPLEAPSASPIRRGGTYVITGGLSSRGRALAEGLAKTVPDVKLALLATAALPPAAEWDALIDAADTAPDLADDLRALRAWQRAGAEVEVLRADVIDEGQTTAALNAVRQRFGQIDGVFHCEGEARRAAMAQKTETDVEDVFAAKVYGTERLGKTAEAAGASFLMLFSSTDAVSAPAGRVEQLGADAFMDAYASAGRLRSTRVVSVEWGDWADPRGAARLQELGARADAGEELAASERALLQDEELAIHAEEGADAAARVLAAATLPQVWVSPVDYRTSVRRAEASRRRLVEARADAAKAAAETQAPAFKHLVPMHRANAGDGTPFFLIAGMFGNVLNLRYLANLVGTDRKFYGVQARGLFGDEQPHDNFQDMVRDYLVEIREVQPHGPYMIGGFSGGGITAYEMARALKAEGEEVAVLLMIDTPLPRPPRDLDVLDRASVQVQRFRRRGPRYLGEWARSRARWEMEKLQERLNGGAEAARGEDQFHNEAVRAAFVHACDVYELEPYAGRLTLFRPKPDHSYALRDGRVLDAHLEPVMPDNGWTPWVDELDVYELPGGHDSMVLEPNVRVMAARLKQCIAEAEQRMERPTRPAESVRVAQSAKGE